MSAQQKKPTASGPPPPKEEEEERKGPPDPHAHIDTSTEQAGQAETAAATPALHGPAGCRMYRETLPAVGQTVIIQVSSVEEIGVYGQLLEYDTLQGLVTWADLTRRQTRGVKTLVRKGQQHPVTVLRVDAEHRYVDLSKTRTRPLDAKACLRRYEKSKAVHSLVYQIARKCGHSMLEIYSDFVWDLYDRFDHALDALQLAAVEPSALLDRYRTRGVPEPILEAALDVIKKKLTPRSVRIRAEVSMQCQTYAGIDAIKEAFRATYPVLEKAGIKDDTKMTALAAPTYLMTTWTTPRHDPASVIETFSQCIAKMEQSLSAAGGFFRLELAPCIIDDKQEASLLARIKQHEKESRLVDGDDDHEDD